MSTPTGTATVRAAPARHAGTGTRHIRKKSTAIITGMSMSTTTDTTTSTAMPAAAGTIMAMRATITRTTCSKALAARRRACILRPS